jgi:hypothetical protein
MNYQQNGGNLFSRTSDYASLIKPTALAGLCNKQMFERHPDSYPVRYRYNLYGL